MKDNLHHALCSVASRVAGKENGILSTAVDDGAIMAGRPITRTL